MTNEALNSLINYIVNDMLKKCFKTIPLNKKNPKQTTWGKQMEKNEFSFMRKRKKNTPFETTTGMKKEKNCL